MAKSILGFIYNSKVENNYTIKTFFGIKSKFVEGNIYKKYIETLEYIKPYSNKNLDDLINDFKLKSLKKRIKPKTFRKDMQILSDLTSSIDPKTLKPAQGILREKQKELLEFSVEILNDIEKNANISSPPYMCGGTLLGACRHGGFIPWDDDVDFCVSLESYQKLIDYFSKKYRTIDTSNFILKQYTNTLHTYLEQYPDEILFFRLFDSLKVVKKHNDSFVFVDFFNFNYYSDEHNCITLGNYIKETNKKIKNLKTFKEMFDFYEKEINKQKDIVKFSNTIQAGIGSEDFFNTCQNLKGILRYEDIFPLKKIKFENVELYAPNNPEMYLKATYNYHNRMPCYIPINKHSNAIK